MASHINKALRGLFIVGTSQISEEMQKEKVGEKLEIEFLHHSEMSL